MKDGTYISMTSYQQFSYTIQATNQIELFEFKPDLNELRKNDQKFFDKLYTDLQKPFGFHKESLKIINMLINPKQDISPAIIKNRQKCEINQGEDKTQKEALLTKISIEGMIRTYLKEKLKPFKQYLTYIEAQIEANYFDKIFLSLMITYGECDIGNIELSRQEIRMRVFNNLEKAMKDEINNYEINFKVLHQMRAISKESERIIKETYNQIFQLIKKEVNLDVDNDIEKQYLNWIQKFHNSFNFQIRNEGLLNDLYSMSAFDQQEMFKRVKEIVKEDVLKGIKDYFKQQVINKTKECLNI